MDSLEIGEEQLPLNKEHLCSNCYEPISNPVCTQCHIRYLNSWLKGTGFGKNKTHDIINEVKEKFTKENISDINCIICKKEYVSVCTYCFFFKVEGILLNHSVYHKKIENLECVFNYKLYSNYKFN